MTTETLTPPPSTKSQVLRSFDVADFPALNGLEEEWRFTPLKRLGALVTASRLDGVAPAVEHGELPAGVAVKHVDAVEPVLTPFDRISALAYGSADGVTLIEVAPETSLDEAIVVRVVGKGGDAAAARTLVQVGAFAKVTVVLEQTGTATLADNVEVVIGDGAQLTFVTLAEWDAGAVQAQHVRFRVGKDARVQHVQVALGGDLVRQFTSVEYAGRGGDAELWGLYFATANPGHGGQHFEHRQLVDHTAPDCRSYVAYRGALQGASTKTVWVGDVLIRHTATGTDTYEINRNLILTDGAIAHSVPNLEIETGEVAGAGHASATGRFDDEQLFYLMARGITEAEARKLVVRGFFADLINKIPVEELRERLGATIETRLAEYSS